MTQIATNLGTTRESARQIRFEPTGALTAVNVQKAIEQVSGGTTPTGTTQLVTSGAVTVQPTDSFIYINFAGTVTVTMPDTAAWLAAHPNASSPAPLTIQDISGNANDSTNKITINRAGADTINGLTSVEIVAPLGGFKFRPPQAGTWAIQ
jgi:hypothetical protein